MKTEAKQKWVAALRSGAYAQARSIMKKEVEGKPSYCCLGVLREVCPVNADMQNINPVFPVSEELIAWDLSHGKANKLASMNDEDRASFDTIADYIEAHPEI